MIFEGKTILVVGASSGIGLRLAQLLAAQGASLYTASRSRPELSYPFEHIPFDVRRAEQSLSPLPDQLHGLVYCPGSISLKPFATTSLETFREELELNVLGAARVLQACQKSLKAAQGASVVLFSSIAAQKGMPYHTTVGMAKGAVEGFARSLAAEWSRAAIRVNCIAPSLTNTPLASRLLSSEEKRTASDQRHPLGRIGQPEDPAQAAAFLLSDNSSWLTGQVLGVDGGLSSLQLV
ncbi:SDR family NAD(P)-dependent oxidoreductase [Cesiribacter andamanensis]|uniref:3-oxoacyl-[acyl-carrier-protein] reductase FabG n=1 Tax=Cesiribacter andamanensis AMV16 TaxID=1279009 RepID=M7N9N5_9BACT|nr:SDR family oxidoreductase [Cesiribacter andamanensis]EMR03916.1 3-oxoacyl-[acyl-carrier-protein] reductase FabG [Cesiribacter andamanensis AMV16]